MNHPHDDEIDALLRRQFDGPVPDDGFGERVMRRLPPRRRVSWPLWAGILAGACLCWLSLPSTPMTHAGWRGWTEGGLSSPATALLAAAACLALLVSWWGVTEADDR